MALPKNSPWGKVQSWTNVADGIDFASTASHGGFKLSRSRQAKMPADLKIEGGWYEEDLAYNRVILAFPVEFTEKQVAHAHAVIKDWYPDSYEAWSGQKVQLSESHVLRERDFKEKHKNDFIVVSAVGSWRTGVPKGFVGVIAERYPGIEKRFLVPEEEYGSGRGEHGFVIDLSRHKEWDYAV